MNKAMRSLRQDCNDEKFVAVFRQGTLYNAVTATLYGSYIHT